MDALVDLLANPKILLRPGFDALSCCVRGIKIGDSAETLEPYRTPEDELGWTHQHEGVAFKVRDGSVYQIRLPADIFQTLELASVDELMDALGFYNEMRRIISADGRLTCGYLWHRGILAWWQLIPKLTSSSIVLFDPVRGVVPDSKNVSFVLDSGELCHREAPTTFALPTLKERKKVRAGDTVKLMFRIAIDDKEFVERMWVQVTEVTEGMFLGTLDNDPYCTSEIQSGMPVEFGVEHIIQIQNG